MRVGGSPRWTGFRLVARKLERGLRVPEGAADGEDPEADPGEQQGDPDDDSEERELRSAM